MKNVRSVVLITAFILSIVIAAWLLTISKPDPAPQADSAPGGSPGSRPKPPMSPATRGQVLPSTAEVREKTDKLVIVQNLKTLFNGPGQEAVPKLEELLADEAFMVALIDAHATGSGGGATRFIRPHLLQGILVEIAADLEPRAAETLLSLLDKVEKDPGKDPYRVRAALLWSLEKFQDRPAVIAALTKIATSQTEMAFYSSPALTLLGRIGTETTARAAESIAKDPTYDATRRTNVISALSYNPTPANLAALARIRANPPGPDTDRRMVIALSRMAGLTTSSGLGLKEPATGAARQQVIALLTDIAATATQAADRQSAQQAIDRIISRPEAP